MKLEGQVALVTGAGSGIGRAIAHRFADEGARVAVNDLTLAAARATAAALPAGRGYAVAADVSDPAAVRAMFEQLDGDLGRLDVLVNNAGIAEGEPGERERVAARAEARLAELMGGGEVSTHLDVTQEMSDASWQRVLGVHLFGTFYCTREALRRMSRQSRGAIVNMSSVAALMGLESVPHYSAAKGGILAFTRAVAREVASRGIRVNAICPGYIDTPMTAPISPLLRRATLARTPLGRAHPPASSATRLWLPSTATARFARSKARVDRY